MRFLKRKICEALFKLYRIRRNAVRRLILRELTKLDGGQMLSQTLRRVFREYHNIEIGLYSYGSCFEPENIAAFTRIGRYCSFADNVHILGQNHLTETKSTHPYFYNPVFGYVDRQLNRVNELSIGNDVWVGCNVTIVPSVSRIGDGAVIGAGSVVTKDVPDFAVVAGNPARLFKYRFSESTIARLKEEKWWDKNIEELQGSFPDFLGEYEAKHKQV